MQTSIRDENPSVSTATDPPVVLLVEDDPRLPSFLERAFLERALAAAGYRVERVCDSEHALSTIERLTPELVLLDVVPPGLTGLEVARQIRAHSDVPIVILSALDGVTERVAGLDAGADDYVGKPFALEELLARLRAVRRGRALAVARATARLRHGSLTYADVTLDLDTREVDRNGRKIELRNKAFELLACFMRHPERVLSRRELLADVWGYDFLGDSNVIEVTVSHIRQALELAGEPRLIHTVRPVGYMLDARAA